MAGNNIIDTAFAESFVKRRISELLSSSRDTGVLRTFHIGEVISSEDGGNANRLRVRIPLLDDVFYLDEDNVLQDDIGDDILPWCNPANNRFIDTPEEGSLVLVGLMNPLTPFIGRIWFSAITLENVESVFNVENLTKEYNEEDNWEMLEKDYGMTISAAPLRRNKKWKKSGKGKINYKTGIKGKDKNKLVFDEKKTTLIQNEKEQKETYIELTENLVMMAGQLEIVSRDSKRREEPVFAKPLFDFIQSQNTLIQGIIQLLATIPGVGNLGINVVPAPDAAKLVTQYAQLVIKFNELKIKGKSDYIKIN
jgi:hypothetical protein